MRSTKKTKETIKQWLHVSASPETRDRIWRKVLFVQEQSGKTNSVFVRLNIWRNIIKTKTVRFAAAAVIAFVVIGGITFLPSHEKWWLGSPAAWGQQIMAELEKVEALVYREQGVFVGRYGSTHVSGTWSRHYEAKDRSRQDRYYEHTDEDTYGPTHPDSVLQHITYEVPDGQDLKQCDVSYEFQCYTIKTREGNAYERNPVDKFRSYVDQLDRADRILDTATFDGRECVGFEINTGKNDDYPNGLINRIWFDVRTKLPVRIEIHGLSLTGQSGETLTLIRDQFEYYVQVPAEMFEQDIPDGFINAEPDEIRAAKTEQQKGKMLYADVPDGLREKVATALQGVKTAIYQKCTGFVRDGNLLFIPSKRIYISEYNWRIDDYSGDQVAETEWYVTEKDDWGKTSFDFNDWNFRLTKTTVNFTDRSYRKETYGNTSHPDNPMDEIIFLAGYMDKADQFFESRQIDGIDCFGFELSAKKYGDNPDTNIHTLWFDSETMLPVRVEFEWFQNDGSRKTAFNRFEWDTELPADTFIPVIPEDFVFDHPDDIQAGREK